MRYKHGYAWVALAALIATTESASGQAQTFRACFVPEVGAMYLIGLPGLPDSCLSEGHDEISWSDGGAPDAGSIGSAELADGSVTSQKIAAGAIASSHLAIDQITAQHLRVGSVRSEQVLDNSLGHVDLGAGSVRSEEVADNSLGHVDLGTGSVRSDEVADNSLTSDDLGPGSVRSNEVLDNSLTFNDLGTGSVRSDEIGNGSVQRVDLAPGAVGIERTVVLAERGILFGGEYYTTTATCPAGYVTSGAGWSFDAGIETSVPVAQESTPVGANEWRFVFYNGASSTFWVTPRLVCIRIVP